MKTKLTHKKNCVIQNLGPSLTLYFIQEKTNYCRITVCDLVVNQGRYKLIIWFSEPGPLYVLYIIYDKQKTAKFGVVKNMSWRKKTLPKC